MSPSSEQRHEDAAEDRRPATKRGRYISNACLNCQKRKVKCSGEHTCRGCQSLSLPCQYGRGRRRRGTKESAKSDEARKSDRVSTGDQRSRIQTVTVEAPERQKNTSDLLLDILSRLSSLEQNHSNLIDLVSPGDELDSLRETALSEVAQDDDGDALNPSAMSNLPELVTGYGASSLYQPIGRLNQTLVGDPPNEQPSPVDSAVTWYDLAPRCINTSIELLERDTFSGKIDEMQAVVDEHFATLNVHYPCGNENQFRAHFQTYIGTPSGETLSTGGPDRYQFLALLNLIVAESKVLREESRTSHATPGWQEFCRAESILHRLTWLGHGNTMTIHCLLVKARYLLYLEKGASAYDTMGRAVRLCFQLGLHNQASWTNCTPFEIVMRQRIFWTVYYLERHISFHNGFPFLIRDANVRVDEPGNYNDKLLFPDAPLPDPTPWHSPGPHMASVIVWAKLAAEVSDHLFRGCTSSATGREFIATMDARIKFATRELPVELQWKGGSPNDAELPTFIVRHAYVLHLRMNQLRLLLHQEQLLSFEYDHDTAFKCTTIATEIIQAVLTQDRSQFSTESSRFATVLYLTSALLPLVCIIVKNDNLPNTRADAINAFKQGLSRLDSLSPTFGAARHSLDRLQKIIATAKQTIRKFNEPTAGLNPGEVLDEGAEALPTDFQVMDFFSTDLQLTSPGRSGEFQQAINDMIACVHQPPQSIDKDFFWSADQLPNDQHMILPFGP